MEKNLPVKPDTPFSDEVISLSTLDQQAQRHYAKVLAFFRIDHGGKQDAVINQLRRGLAVSLSETPDFASMVVPVPGSTRKELQLRLGPDSAVPWRVVDYTQQEAAAENVWQYGTYDEIASRHFSLADIPPELLVDPACLHVPEDAQEVPALAIQVNLIRGGLILAICWHHTVCDARSLNVLANSWARHTAASLTNGGPDSPPSQTAEGTRERWRLSYGSRNATLADLPDYVADAAARSPLSAGSAHLHDRVNCVETPFVISTWYLSAAALQSLRSVLGAVSAANESFTPVEAVSALVWRHVTRARFLRVPSEEDADGADGAGQLKGTSLFSTRLDFRARLRPPLPGDFIGNVCEPNARARVPQSEVCAPGPRALVALASAIRAGTEAVDDAVVRAYIGLVNELPAVTDLTWGYDLFPGPDLGVTDLSGLDSLRADWGRRLGAPECVRLATRENGLVYIFPIDREGGFEVQVQCEAEALDRMKRDGEFTEYAAFVV
ncbi:transferase family-domain-containing protein [Staphylotrichum tortipilum]|uniref:Transferase family-domain-containing protein n=1 Tax=Staphylotrichum tortipilum TaxID=2831512 RepID=A0AAN6MQW7_9PEZI|nr:transferase family-domain-containing protein [Staphylotrichum longicolle]